MGERLKLNSVSGNVVSFDTDLERKLGSLKIGIEPVQEGSGDPSPDNVRPISGYTSINIIQQKKNFFDADTQYEIYKQSDGSYLGQGTKFDAIRMYIPSFLINQQITFSTLIRKPENSTITNPRVCAVVNGSTLNGNFINTLDYSLSSITFIPKSVNDYIRITYGSSGSGIIQLKNIQLEIGSTATDYEPYVNATYPITLPSAAGTVYGGELDLAKGILSVNWIKINASDITWSHRSTYPDGVFQALLPYPRATNEINIISDVYKGVSHGYTVANMPNQTIKGNINTVYNYHIYIRDDRYTTIEEFNNNLNVNIVYELETPQTYSLTPTEISTLLGANTLYADCGPIQEASYFSRDYVPVASDTGLITITDGVEAPIDSLKIHFEPIQEGSGDPSPENVRPISGWRGANIIRCGKNLLNPFNNPMWNYNLVYTVNQDGSVTYAASDGRSWSDGGNLVGLPLKKGQYTLSFNEPTICNLRTSIDNYTGNYRTESGILSFILSEDCIVKWKTSSTTYPITRYIQLELGSSATSYEPYISQTYSVTFPSEAGTVYGGYVDVAKGELVVDRELITLDGITNKITGAWGDTQYGSALYFTGIGKRARFTPTISNVLQYSYTGYPAMPLYSFPGTSGANVTCTIVLPTGTTVDQGNQWLQDMVSAGTPVQVTRLLESVATYSLTPTQLSTIKGLNNIYSNANGAIEMSYYSPVKENMIATRRSVIASAPHTETASGGIVSFDTNMTAKLKNLTVNIEPVQDLHGQDAPYPPGGGKNKFDGEYPNIASVLKYRAIHIGDGTFTMSSNIPLTPNSNAANIFFLAGDVSTGASTTTNGVYNGQSRTVTAVDGYVTVAYRNADNTNPASYNTQIESGSTATLYVPYSNICPISGWTGANVTRTGKNLLNKSELIDGYVQVSDGNHISVTWIKCTDYLRCVSGLTIHSRNTCSSSSTIRGICFYDKNKNFISGNVQQEDTTNEKMYSVPSNAVYFRINVSTSVADSAVVGFDTVEGYTQYQSEIYPISFPTEAGTVYGGTLDVTTGVLTVDRTILVLGSNSGYRIINSPSYAGANNTHFYLVNVKPYNDALQNAVCNIAVKGFCDAEKDNYNNHFGNDGNSLVHFQFANSWLGITSGDGVSERIEKLRTHFTANPCMFCYKIATPQTYQLTPTEIQTLLGANNIYADTGNTNLTYWKH